MSDVAQLKVTLPLPLYDYVHSRASRFGLTLSLYVKNLILNDVKDMDIPVYTASKKLEKSYKKALRERRGAVEVNDTKKYLKGV
ncbi:MAG: hypothetical protein A2804_01685 [Candidatus Pacebacteria bacterium RIFCSPHIGHO2_01_FULL_46_10]|nr:MAG: hypothetical protein A2804_01685 [Candidatus Pacebacteria bacterium RIFCSPHIGHO2_01_FULL_46_10]